MTAGYIYFNLSEEAQELIKQNKIYSEYNYKEICILYNEFKGLLQHLKNEDFIPGGLSVIKKHIKDIKTVKKYYEVFGYTGD